MMLRSFIQDLASDGYSVYFLAAFLVSLLPLTLHLIKHGFTWEEETEDYEMDETDF